MKLYLLLPEKQPNAVSSTECWLADSNANKIHFIGHGIGSDLMLLTNLCNKVDYDIIELKNISQESFIKIMTSEGYIVS